MPNHAIWNLLIPIVVNEDDDRGRLVACRSDGSVRQLQVNAMLRRSRCQRRLVFDASNVLQPRDVVQLPKSTNDVCLP